MERIFKGTSICVIRGDIRMGMYFLSLFSFFLSFFPLSPFPDYIAKLGMFCFCRKLIWLFRGAGKASWYTPVRFISVPTYLPSYMYQIVYTKVKKKRNNSPRNGNTSGGTPATLALVTPPPGSPDATPPKATFSNSAK